MEKNLLISQSIDSGIVILENHSVCSIITLYIALKGSLNQCPSGCTQFERCWLNRHLFAFFGFLPWYIQERQIALCWINTIGGRKTIGSWIDDIEHQQYLLTTIDKKYMYYKWGKLPHTKLPLENDKKNSLMFSVCNMCGVTTSNLRYRQCPQWGEEPIHCNGEWQGPGLRLKLVQCSAFWCTLEDKHSA